MVLGACVAAMSATPPQPDVELTVRPVLVAGAFEAVDIAVAFRGDADGETRLALPDAWGGETRLWAAISDLRAEGAVVRVDESPAHRRLQHAPGARIQVRYRLKQETAGAPVAGERNPYRVLVQPGWFHLLGETIVALPEGVRMRGTARLRVEGMPAHARFASDAQHAGAKVRDLVESVMVGGDFRVIDAGGGLRIAIRGTWPIEDAAWRTAIARIGADQRAYWGAAAEPYLVTIVPLGGAPGAVSVGGTGRGDGFAFFATQSAPLPMISRLLSHEMMHTWIPSRIGGLPETDEAGHYWLSEGFTDWAAWRVNVRGGLWSAEEFASAFNAALEAYDTSPARTASNARILQDFWSDAAVQKLPYQRGMLIASLWDYRVRKASGGARDLDDVLMRMQRGAVRRPDLSATALLPEAMRRVAGVETAVDRTRLVSEGHVVDLPRDLFAPCGDIVDVRKPVWVRGFDFQATQRNGWTIEGVEHDSAAWRAGLRNGMRLTSWSERSDALDATKPVTAGVEHNGARHEITWMPTDGRAHRVRKLALREGFGRTACTRLLAGLPPA